MATKTVKLTDRHSKFVQQSVKQGRFASENDVFNAAIRLLQEEEARNKLKLKHLRKLVKEGFDSIDRGEGTVVTDETLDDFLDSLRAPIRRAKSA